MVPCKGLVKRELRIFTKYFIQSNKQDSKPGTEATTRRSKRWAWTGVTEWNASPRWAGTTSASGTPPTTGTRRLAMDWLIIKTPTGTTAASNACWRRAAQGERYTRRRWALPTSWPSSSSWTTSSLLQQCYRWAWPSSWSRPPRESRRPPRLQRRVGRPISPAPAPEDRHHLRFLAKTMTKTKTKILTTSNRSGGIARAKHSYSTLWWFWAPQRMNRPPAFSHSFPRGQRMVPFTGGKGNDVLHDTKYGGASQSNHTCSYESDFGSAMMSK